MAGQGKPGAAAAASLDNHTSQQKTQLKLEGGPTVRGPPPKTHTSTAFQNSVTSWGPNVQTQKSAEDILHSIHSI